MFKHVLGLTAAIALTATSAAAQNANAAGEATIAPVQTVEDDDAPIVTAGAGGGLGAGLGEATGFAPLLGGATPVIAGLSAILIISAVAGDDSSSTPNTSPAQ